MLLLFEASPFESSILRRLNVVSAPGALFFFPFSHSIILSFTPSPVLNVLQPRQRSVKLFKLFEHLLF